MTNREKYIKAAELIKDKDVGDWDFCAGCCEALSFVKLNQKPFRDKFMPNNATNWEYWYGKFNKKNQLARSIALLFMAEMEND